MEHSTTRTRSSDPAWWNAEHDSAWERVKAALKRDWEQTKHDFGGDEPDTDQDVDDTVAQAVGKQPIPPPGAPTIEEEADYRFGYGARRQYGEDFDEWDENLESRLRQDWETVHPEDANNWSTHRRAIRYGWEYNG